MTIVILGYTVAFILIFVAVVIAASIGMAVADADEKSLNAPCALCFFCIIGAMGMMAAL